MLEMQSTIVWCGKVVTYNRNISQPKTCCWRMKWGRLHAKQESIMAPDSTVILQVNWSYSMA